MNTRWRISTAVALVALPCSARADPVCDEFHAIALMSPATVATHERGADPNWFDDSEKLSDLTLNGAPCTIGTNDDGIVAHVDCPLELNDAATVGPFFDVVDECLKNVAKNMSRGKEGREDLIWTTGAMVKMYGSGGLGLNVRFVY